jgi:hypothetical protein
MSFMGKSSTTPKVFLGLRQQGDSREACSAGAVASPEGRTPGEKASIPLSSQPVKVKRLPRAPTASTILLDEREAATRVTERFARRPNRSNSPRRPRSFQEDGDQNSKGIRTSPHSRQETQHREWRCTLRCKVAMQFFFTPAPRESLLPCPGDTDQERGVRRRQGDIRCEECVLRKTSCM